jgi:hypothetical protein
MNWTGGRLSRHSRNCKSTVLSLQKQHFAKVRKREIRGIPRPSPTRWSVFDTIELENPQWRTDCLSGPQIQQSRTDLAKQKRTSSQEAIVLKRKRHARNNFSDVDTTNTDNPILSEITDDDIYNATPEPPNLARHECEHTHEREHQPKHSLPQNKIRLNTKEGKVSLEEKKRRLLGRGDWIGINFQQPIKLKFTPLKDDEILGKRRKLSDDHRRRGAKRQTPVISPFARRQKEIVALDGAHPQVRAVRPLQLNNDVRISIGGREIRSGIGSSTVDGRNPPDATDSSQNSVSDFMLLDSDQDGNIHDNTRGDNLLQTQSTFDTITENTKYIENSDYVLTLPLGTKKRRHSSPFDDQSYDECTPNPQARTYTKPVHKGSPSVIYSINENLPVLKIGAHMDNDNEQPHSVDFLCSRKEREFGTMGPAQSKYPTDSPPLYHPAPRSAQRSALLSSNSSADPRSIPAEMSLRRPVVSPRQYPDNEIWKACVPLLEYEQLDGNYPFKYEQLDLEEKDAVNPCASRAIGEASPKDNILISSSQGRDGEIFFELEQLEHETERHIEVPNTTKQQNLRINCYPASQREPSTESSLGDHHVPLSHGSHSFENAPIIEIDYRNSFILGNHRREPSRQAVIKEAGGELSTCPNGIGKLSMHQVNVFQTNNSSGQQPLRSTRREDPDAAWMKFILGSESDKFDTKGILTPVARASPCIPTSGICDSSQVVQPSSVTPTISSPVALIPTYNTISEQCDTSSVDPSMINDGSSMLDLIAVSDLAETQECDSTNDSVTAQPSQSQHARIELPSSASISPLKHKFMFTKPKPYVGQTRKQGNPMENKKEIYFARLSTRRIKQDDRGANTRYISSLTLSDEEDIESVSDD